MLCIFDFCCENYIHFIPSFDMARHNSYKPISDTPFNSYYENVSWHKYETPFLQRLAVLIKFLKNFSKMAACHRIYLFEIFLISGSDWDPHGIYKQMSIDFCWKGSSRSWGEMRHVYKCREHRRNSYDCLKRVKISTIIWRREMLCLLRRYRERLYEQSEKNGPKF